MTLEFMSGSETSQEGTQESLGLSPQRFQLTLSLQLLYALILLTHAPQ